VNALPKGSLLQLASKTTEKVEEVTTRQNDTVVEMVERKRYLSRTASAVLPTDEKDVGGEEKRRELSRHQSLMTLGNTECKKRKENLKKSLGRSQGVTFADADSNLTSDDRTNEECERPWQLPDISIEDQDVQGHDLQRSVTRTTTTSRTTVTTTIHSVESSPRKGSGTHMV
jgi:hypothetical protein